MTVQEFERAKQLEKEIREVRFNLNSLKEITSGMYISSFNSHNCVSVPNGYKLTIQKLVKMAYEEELKKLETEFADLVSE